MDALTPRTWFATATKGVLDVVDGVPDTSWDAPGLGEWSVRELLAHTIRSWTLIETYLAEPVQDGEPIAAGPYFAAGMTQLGIHDGVRSRAQADAEALGDDLVNAAKRAAAESLAVVDATPDERLLATRFAPMQLSEFLRTRALELTVHGLDLAKATGARVPDELADAAVPAVALLAEVARERGLVVDLLLAASGRAPLMAGFTLFG